MTVMFIYTEEAFTAEFAHGMYASLYFVFGYLLDISMMHGGQMHR
jgi:hypothetical protein